MTLRTTEILELLESHAGSYVLRNLGTYRVKNADGTDMVKIEGGRTCVLEPSHQMMDDLMAQGRLKQNGQKYTLA
jgi:hypothetical protein